MTVLIPKGHIIPLRPALRSWRRTGRSNRSDGSYYTGSTNNLDLRLTQHQAGEGCIYTRSRLPVEMVYAQEFAIGLIL